MDGPPGARARVMVRSSLDSLQDALGYRFRKPELLVEALTHSSFARESSSGVRQDLPEFTVGDFVSQKGVVPIRHPLRGGLRVPLLLV